MMKEVDYLPIVFVSNGAGATMLGVALYSLLASKRPTTFYRIYILEDGLSAGDKEKILSLQAAYGCSISFIPIGPVLRSHVTKEFAQWPSTVYGRLFLPSLLPEEKRVLYLDIDVLVVRDLSEVFAASLGSSLLGAVYQRQDAVAARWKQRLGIPPPYPYFNSGVLLMDLKGMRREGTEKRLADYLRRHEGELVCPDQDVLNAVLYDRVRGVHPQWNWPHSLSRRFLFRYKRMKARWGDCPSYVMAQAVCRPHVIHFMGLPKPTQYNYTFYGALYRKIWLESPWREVPMGGGKRGVCFFRRVCYFPLDCLVRLKVRFFRKGRRVDGRLGRAGASPSAGAGGALLCFAFFSDCICP